jgi:hypothetical protein
MSSDEPPLTSQTAKEVLEEWDRQGKLPDRRFGPEFEHLTGSNRMGTSRTACDREDRGGLTH